MIIIKLIILIGALISVFMLIIRDYKTGKRWKIVEPELVRGVENNVNQKVTYKVMLNAGESMCLIREKSFFLWVAFTSDYIAFAERDSIASDGDGYIYFSKKTDTSMKRLKKGFMELEFKDMKSSEQVRFVVMGRTRDIDLLISQK